jgi:hypothetical protein
VDFVDLSAGTRQSPFENSNMMSMGSRQGLPVHLEDGFFHLAELIFTGLGEGTEALATRRLLFGESDGNRPGQMASNYLTTAIVFSAWQINVQYLENRFNVSRHDAIADPSLLTFHPLTLLRRNIADLEDALITAKEDIQAHWLRTAQDRSHNQRVQELFGPRYDALLQRVIAMSTKLNNEIQLVIGSVTVQVCVSPLLHPESSS